VKPNASHFAAFFLLATLGGLCAVAQVNFAHTQDPNKGEPEGTARPPGEEKFDYNQQQSPTRPTPKWLKFKDQGDDDPRLKGYRTPEGIKVEIVAEAPTVVNPVGMTFANDGTPYVLEWRPDQGPNNFPESSLEFTYKDGSKHKVAVMTKNVKDVVKVLRDTKGKGVYDEAKVILEDELPSSILLHDGWLYLSGRGTVRRYKQSKPNGPFDVKEVVAQGFCGFHHHQVSGMTIGNDGWLYLTAGDDDNDVEGSDGSRATVLRTGVVFRCRPDGSKMQPFAMGFRNPYRDVAFDAAFNMFHADNDNEDGSKFTGCRLMHIAEGNDFGWRLKTGARCCVPDAARGAVFGELPGKVPPLIKTGRGAPAGLLIYNDTRFSDNYRGLIFYPDVFRKSIRAYKVEPEGASFVVSEEFEFMKSDDPLFRPCQMVLGPDGAMYVVDWRTDSGGAGRLWGDGEHGRIYRVTWAGTKDQPALEPRPIDSWAKIEKQEIADLLKTLESEDFSDRVVAQREIVKRGSEARPLLLKLLLDKQRPQRARIAALGALQSFWNDAVRKAFFEILQRGEPDLQRLAADGLGLNAAVGDEKVHVELLKHLGDEEPAVRRAVMLAMGRVNAPAAAGNLVRVLNDEGNVGDVRDGLVRAIEYTGKPGVEELLLLADSGVAKDTILVARVFTMMRTRPAYEALPQIMMNEHLNAKQRAALMRSYNNYLLDPPISVEPALDYLIAHPSDDVIVRLAGLEVLSTAGVLTSEKAAKWLLEQLDEDDPAVRLAVVKAVEDTRLTKAAPRLVKLAADGTRPAPERLAVVKALGKLDDRAAVPVLKEILRNEELKTRETTNLRLEALHSLSALDADAAVECATTFLGKKDAALQAAAVSILGGDAKGTKLVARLYLDGKLPRELLPEVSDALRKHAPKSEELAKLLTEVMKTGLLLSNSPEEVARVEALVKTKGDPKRGRSLYLNNKTLACITCHRLEGVGGNIGPDLTRVWDTQTVAKLMESIIEPSKEIKEGYQSYEATTKKGKVTIGLKISQTADEVVLREATGHDVRISAKELDTLTPSKLSLMPDNVVGQLTYNQFIDLIAFLKDRKAQESLRGFAMAGWVGGGGAR
jgi:quinoprotein glucose dehydrogenase